MRLLLYNIAYCTGSPRSGYHNLLSGYRYLLRSRETFTEIADYIESKSPDIVGLIEVDGGSYRSGWVNHAAEIATRLRHYHSYNSKYHADALSARLPLLRHQGNAILTRDQCGDDRFHFFDCGMKRLIIEVELGALSVFLVHLSLARRTRRMQLRTLAELVGKCHGPVIVAGDFNTFAGNQELHLFCTVTGLTQAMAGHHPTFPAWRPSRQLDFTLCSSSIHVRRFQVDYTVRLSDHLPILLDFEY